ncbi:hypothetical protein H9Y04_31720 [Streptomyces sp. TRM66268-LWL]|uniref:Uncharacterized protein n=1 Tax=Streptomyces polyasparticus TaxID=2767826 RepID=A0ABR7SP18_9ACTN|nr:hypothetical protein [Streptomyces polyasparticus]MBC9717109.1 hypothetical protein [Streptomyces polyasparticus]
MRTWWRGRRLYVIGATVVVVAAGVLVPVTTAGPDDETCWTAPASVTRLAKNPEAATAALDPGDDLSRLDAVTKLLSHDDLCDPADLGAVIEAATVSQPGTAHTKAQARATYAVAGAYDDPDGQGNSTMPSGLEPFVARMVADYIVDAGRKDYMIDKEDGPADPAEDLVADEFPHPGEAHVAFTYRRYESSIEGLVENSARDPEAFALLYDAELAALAHYLERVDPKALLIDEDLGEKDGGRKPRKVLDHSTKWTVRYAAERVGTLLGHRFENARSGEITDVGAFDREVRRRLKGEFRTAPELVRSRPVMGDIARRPAAAKLSGDAFDGRARLLGILDTWADSRAVPQRTAVQLRNLVTDGYLNALRNV